MGVLCGQMHVRHLASQTQTLLPAAELHSFILFSSLLLHFVTLHRLFISRPSNNNNYINKVIERPPVQKATEAKVIEVSVRGQSGRQGAMDHK